MKELLPDEKASGLLATKNNSRSDVRLEIDEFCRRPSNLSRTVVSMLLELAQSEGEEQAEAVAATALAALRREHTSRQFKKRPAHDLLRLTGWRIPAWADHAECWVNKKTGERVYVSHPYDLGEQDWSDLFAFAQAHGFEVCLSANSEYWPGRTIAIVLRRLRS